MCGGGPTTQAINIVGPYMGGVQVGAKLQIYWGHWVQRSSFRSL